MQKILLRWKIGSNDGVPLVANVAIECLEDWYAENKPMQGKWRSGGQAVNPRLIDVPTLVIIPEKDTIVPPASASPLIDSAATRRDVEFKCRTYWL